jgi:nucleotide-binding universal stress UspA family protein
MYKKMLVLLDGSKMAEVVFKYAQELSGRLNINLELLLVCNPQDADQLPMRQAYIERMAEALRASAEEIRSQNGEPANQSIQSQGSVVVGYPPEEILKYVETNNIDLIMLSTHGNSGIRLWDLGSVAIKVIHATKVPVWLVPSELRDEVIFDKVPKRLMVIPLNGSKVAEGVIPYAIDIAKQRGSETEMVLVYVDSYIGSTLSLDDIKRKQNEKQAMRKYLDGMVATIKANGIAAKAEMLYGDPPSTIINYVKNNPTQLIAMATHGQSGLTRMIFGSVTENILNMVKKTPILLVKPQE